jgi:hypothetical protein
MARDYLSAPPPAESHRDTAVREPVPQSGFELHLATVLRGAI